MAGTGLVGCVRQVKLCKFLPTMFVPPVQLLWSQPAGTVIRVNAGFYNHVGLLGDRFINDERGILTFSAKAKGFVEEPLSGFSGGRLVVCDGYLGNLPPPTVVWRARLKAEQPYSWRSISIASTLCAMPTGGACGEPAITTGRRHPGCRGASVFGA